MPKKLLDKNTPAYFAAASPTKKKSFITARLGGFFTVKFPCRNTLQDNFAKKNQTFFSTLFKKLFKSAVAVIAVIDRKQQKFHYCDAFTLIYPAILLPRDGSLKKAPTCKQIFSPFFLQVQTAGRLDSNPLPWDDEVLLYL
jgi:hypothetical protein